MPRFLFIKLLFCHLAHITVPTDDYGDGNCPSFRMPVIRLMPASTATAIPVTDKTEDCGVFRSIPQHAPCRTPTYAHFSEQRGVGIGCRSALRSHRYPARGQRQHLPRRDTAHGTQNYPVAHFQFRRGARNEQQQGISVLVLLESASLASERRISCRHGAHCHDQTKHHDRESDRGGEPYANCRRKPRGVMFCAHCQKETVAVIVTEISALAPPVRSGYSLYSTRLPPDTSGTAVPSASPDPCRAYFPRFS